MLDGILTEDVRRPLPLDAFPALVLNGDGLPLTYDPLPKMPWQDAVKNVTAGDMIVVSEYDIVVRSPSLEMRLPAVIMSKVFVDRNLPAPLTRRNLFVRDRYTCQYCGTPAKSSELSFEHIVPRSRGGASSWTNLVAACLACNARKGARTPAEAGMRLLRQPWHPTIGEMTHLSKGRVSERRIPKEWADFVTSISDAYWNEELDP